MDKFIKIDKLEPELITIVNAIKHLTGIDIRTPIRKGEIVSLKKIYYKIARGMTTKSLSEICNLVKTTNHGTVLYHLDRVDDMLEENSHYRRIYEEIFILVNKSIKVSVKEEKDRIIYFVDKVIDERIKFVDRMVDTGLPKHIIEHLLQYNEDELSTLYDTRMVPYAKMLGKGEVTER